MTDLKTARIIDGKAIAADIRSELKTKVEALGSKRKPGLAVIIVGDDPASHFYVRSKEKFSKEIGFESFKSVLPETASKADVIKLINEYNNDNKVDGILLQLPLPQKLKEETQDIINTISSSKDVDGLTYINQGKLLNYEDSAVEPCTPKGCMELLKRSGIELSGKKAIVIGRSALVGKPMAILLSKANATVTLAHSRTQNLEEEVRSADIVIAAIGRKEFVKGSWIKRGAVVIDVGINAVEEAGAKKLYGDVDYAEAVKVSSAISPVPGGVGPMTIAMLLVNTFELYNSHN